MLPPLKMVSIKNPASFRTVYVWLALAGVALLAACAPPGPRALLRGKELMERGLYTEALQQLRSAVELLPTNAIAWQYYGVACQKTGQITDAERAYQRALAIDRNLMEARYNLGCLYLDANRLDDAKTQFTAYHLRKGNSPEGLIKLGTAQLRSREITAAERSLTEALRLSPKNPEALNALGMARMMRSRPQEAAQIFENVVRDHPGYAPAWLNLAVVRQQHLRNPAGALKAYSQYAALQPGAANAENVRAIIKSLDLQLAPPPASPPPTIAMAPQPATAPQVAAAPPPREVPSQPQPQPRYEPEPVRVEKAVQPILAPRASTAATPPRTAARPIIPQAPEASVTPSQPPPAEPPSKVPATDAARLAAAPVLKLPGAESEPGPGTPIAPIKTPATITEVNAPRPPVIVTNTLPVETVVPPPQIVSVPRQTESLAPVEELPAGVPPSSLIITTSSVPGQIASPARRSVWQTLNPANLWRGNAEPSAPPKPGIIITTAPPIQVLSAAPRPAPSSAPPRYLYKNPRPPVAGDRKAAEKLLSQGIQAHTAQNLQTAVQDYREAARLDPGFFEAHYNLGLANAELGNLQAALASYETALAVRPASTNARYNLALVLWEAGYHLDAAKELEKILAQHPNETRARLALGNLFAQKLNQPQKAREQYLKVLELEPDNPQASALRSWLALHPVP